MALAEAEELEEKEAEENEAEAEEDEDEAEEEVPTLEELAGDWTKANMLRDTPALSNWLGSVGTNYAVVDTTAFIAPPYVGTPSMVTLRVDGKAVELDTVRWAAYAAGRRSKPVIVGDHTLTVTSELRMAWNDSALLWKVTCENTPMARADPNAIGYEDIIHTLEFSIQAMARRREDMGWLLTDNLPTNPAEFHTAIMYPSESGQRAMVLHSDTLSDAVSGFVFVDQQPNEWAWVPDYQKRNRSAAIGTVDFFVAPGEKATMRIVAAMGPAASSVEKEALDHMVSRLDDYADHFDSYFDGAKMGWDKVWDEAFTPPQPPSSSTSSPPRLFSGHLPTLHTTDLAVHRLYYMGILSLLSTGRTSLSALSNEVSGLSSFITGFGNTCWTRPSQGLAPAEVECLKPSTPRDTILKPVYIGGSAQFFWDTALRSLLTTLLDPEAMRRYIVSFLSWEGQKFERSFGLDIMTGRPLGYEYAFNSYSIFTIVSTYVRVTNDTAFLDLRVGGEGGREGGATVGERLEEVALDWRKRRVPKPVAVVATTATAATAESREMENGGRRSNSRGETLLEGLFSLWWPWSRKSSFTTTASSSSSSSGSGNDASSAVSGKGENEIKNVEKREKPVTSAVKGYKTLHRDPSSAYSPSSSNSSDSSNGSSFDDSGLYYLADYGPHSSNFLECIPTYVHVAPALQAANAEMMALLATLRVAEGNYTGAALFREMSTKIARETVEHLYVRGGEGTWGCLYPEDYSLVPVRHIVDFIYVSRGLAVAEAACAASASSTGAGIGGTAAAAAEGGDSAAAATSTQPFLPREIAGAMSLFFHDELQTPSWTRALSPYDRLNLRVPRPRSILRPDHGITGAFDAWAALAVESLAYNAGGDWEDALETLRSMAASVTEGPFGQAHEITEMSQSAFKTKRGFTRYTADNGGSFSEVILRGIFAYDPPFAAIHDEGLPFKGLEAAVKRGGKGGRGGLVATLEGLQTPWGLATLEVGGEGGVRIKEVV
ncbi:Hypothetical protein NocV09_01600660 [Nannochloropsis oceanica]